MGNAFVPNDTLMNSCGVPGTGVPRVFIVDVGFSGGRYGKKLGLCYHGNFRNRKFCLILYLDDKMILETC